jgi:hypothetical protein
MKKLYLLLTFISISTLSGCIPAKLRMFIPIAIAIIIIIAIASIPFINDYINRSEDCDQRERTLQSKRRATMDFANTWVLKNNLKNEKLKERENKKKPKK